MTTTAALASSGREPSCGAAADRSEPHSGDGIRDHANQAGHDLSPQAGAAEVAHAVSHFGQGSPGLASPGEDGWRAVAAAVVEALDGSQRKLLLARLADTDPDVVVAGVTWMEQWHAANAERRREARKEKSRDRRRRQRRDGARAR